MKGDPASKSTKIEWKSGMDITAKILQNGNNRKRKRGPRRSFFQWFQDNTDPSGDDIAEVVFKPSKDKFNHSLALKN